MRKEILCDGITWYCCDCIIPNGTYKFYIDDDGHSFYQLIDKNAIKGSICNKYYDFTEFVNKLTKLGITTLVDRMVEKKYSFDGYGCITLTDEELKLLKNTDYAKYIIKDNKLRLDNIVKPFEYVSTGEYTVMFEDGYIYINDKNHYLIQNYFFSDKTGLYYSDDEEDNNKFIEDFYYKINDSSKLQIYLPTNSISEYITNDEGYYEDYCMYIYCVDTKEKILSIEKELNEENKPIFRYVVDITNENQEHFNIELNIKSKEHLKSLIRQTIDVLNNFSQFSKYVEDLENCL